jgi:hypothetical protein
MLEAHMACLRMGFEHWLEIEPIEPEGSTLTEEQVQEFEEKEQLHEKAFNDLEHRAAKLSQTLGVAKLKDASLKNSFLGFMREGVRFSFDGNGGQDDDLVVGSRLPFLLILSKYVYDEISVMFQVIVEELTPIVFAITDILFGSSVKSHIWRSSRISSSQKKPSCGVTPNMMRFIQMI